MVKINDITISILVWGAVRYHSGCFLLAKLPHYAKEIEGRNRIANAYTAQLKEDVMALQVKLDRTSVWAQYTVRVSNREQLQKKFKEQGIPTAVHYPIPLHLQECFQYLGRKEGDFPLSEILAKEVMSLPMNPFINDKEISYISNALR